MNTGLLIPLIGSVGGLAGVAGFLHFWNTRKGARGKSDGEAYTVFSTWVAGAMGQAAAENTRLNDVVAAERAARAVLVQLAVELIAFIIRKNVDRSEVEPYQLRLDEARRM